MDEQPINCANKINIFCKATHVYLKCTRQKRVFGPSRVRTRILIPNIMNSTDVSKQK